MRIQKIRFENIHSLRGEYEIDFANGHLSDAGLFAITGPTGSGKSTLLDVISLALFNKIARINSTISNATLEDEGGIMTRNTTSCYAEVEYSCNGKTYRSHWSIARNRNNNLNPRKQELVLVETGEILESGTKTPEKNQEIIGLSYEQFVKAIVLAQGEFSKLLQASRNDRNKLLEDITGARHYRQIGVAVFDRQAKLKNEIALKEAGLEGIQLLAKEEVSEKTEVLKTLNEKKPVANKAADEARQRVEIRTELEKKQEEQKQWAKEKEQYDADLKIYLPFKIQLETHDNLVKHLETIRNYDGISKTREELKNEQENLIKAIEDSEKNRNSLLKEASVLIKKEVISEKVIEALEEFREHVEKLRNQENLEKHEMTLYLNQVQTQIKTLATKAHRFSSLEIPDNFQKDVAELHQENSAVMAASGLNSIAEVEAKLRKQREAQEIGRELLMNKERMLKIQTALEKIENQKKENLQKIGEHVREKSESEARLKEISEEISALEKTIEHQKLHQSLEAHRNRLKEDEPCPLCGSLSHPYATDNPVLDVQEDLLLEKKSVHTQLNKLLASLETSTKALERENSRFQKDLTEQQKESETLQNFLQDLGVKIGWDEKQNLEDLTAKYHRIGTQIDLLEKSKTAFEIDSILQQLRSNFNLWKSKTADFEAVKNRREQLYQGSDINTVVSGMSQKINRNLAQTESQKRQFSQNSEKLKTISAQLENEHLIIQGILQQEALEDLAALRRGIMDEARANKIRLREKELNATESRLQERKKLLEARLEYLFKEDNPEYTLEVLREQADNLKNEVANLNLQIGKISQELEQHYDAKKRQDAVLEQLKALRKDYALWKKMSDLIGDRTGNKFSHFVQDLTLKQLIGYTNKRLKDFSDRYVLDASSAEGTSDSLYVLDQYMGNSRRSVKTLSGGETFLVSLAMAFALSDIAAKNVKIESLFIDEGFGTLDPDTLDQAITVLEKMQNEGNRSIGIISHVDDLKKRISTQIQLEKGSLGFSTLKIVG